MMRTILRGFALAAAVALAAPASADTLRIPMGPVSAEPQPVRLAAGDAVGKTIFWQHYRPTDEDALPGRVSIFADEQRLSLEDWLREWGAVQIQQIGRPY